jgi:hypothetical protein
MLNPDEYIHNPTTKVERFCRWKLRIVGRRLSRMYLCVFVLTILLIIVVSLLIYYMRAIHILYEQFEQCAEMSINVEDNLIRRLP